MVKLCFFSDSWRGEEGGVEGERRGLKGAVKQHDVFTLSLSNLDKHSSNTGKIIETLVFGKHIFRR